MKKICFVLIFLIASVISFAQVSLESQIKPGSKLIYAVESGEQHYDFIITIKALTPALIFDWEMTDPINTSGTITHTAGAMLAATSMYNYFSPGAKTLDDNTISVWLSKNIVAGLMKTGKGIMMKMNTNEAPKKMGTYAESGELKVIVNGKKETVEEQTAKELNDQGQPAGNEDFFTFYKSPKMPVILRMRNGFYIVLKEIKTK